MLVPIPDYQTVMSPLLKLASDQQEHGMSDTIDALAAQFKLSDAERRKMLPSGGTTVFGSRVGWARTYLKKAGLLESAGRSKFRVSSRGLDVLKENPSALNTKFLRRFPEFNTFQAQTKPAQSAATKGTLGEPAQTPQERLESAAEELKRSLAEELLDRIKTCSPRFFEHLVVDLLVKMGYGGSRREAGQIVGKTGDGGIDGIIKEDKLGLDTVYVQAKRWEGSVGRPVVQGFCG